ncbi:MULTISPECIES: hypothetical protein [Bradyrhizobium]|uniref:hypothetical protein n=1 Tax=Bradyrhizobium TaxID=374 RepID=UPI000561829E|nr:MULTISPECIES: hypothetical protein [Bradyrhizobium]
MSRAADQFANTLPSATPIEAALRAWEALSRAEQICRYQGLFALPDCNIFTADTPDDILLAARQRVAQRSRG